MTTRETILQIMGYLAETYEKLKGEEWCETRRAIEEAFEILDEIV